MMFRNSANPIQEQPETKTNPSKKPPQNNLKTESLRQDQPPSPTAQLARICHKCKTFQHQNKAAVEYMSYRALERQKKWQYQTPQTPKTPAQKRIPPQPPHRPPTKKKSSILEHGTQKENKTKHTKPNQGAPKTKLLNPSEP